MAQTLILRITQLEELRHGILIGADLVASIMIKQRRDDLDEILEQSYIIVQRNTRKAKPVCALVTTAVPSLQPPATSSEHSQGVFAATDDRMFAPFSQPLPRLVLDWKNGISDDPLPRLTVKYLGHRAQQRLGHPHTFFTICNLIVYVSKAKNQIHSTDEPTNRYTWR